MLDWWLIFPKN